MRMFTHGRSQCSKTISSRKENHKATKKRPVWYKTLAVFLCLCMAAGSISIMTNFVSAEDSAGQNGAGPTNNIFADSRVADPNTMDDYKNKLLNDKNGTRYAGRVWTDKTVFAYGATEENGGVKDNEIVLDNDTDGYDGKVKFDDDFAHVFSALASTQVVNEYPPSPIDMVLVLDISSSMSDSSQNNPSIAGQEKVRDGTPYEGTSEVLKVSRFLNMIDAANDVIGQLMDNNPENRVGVVVYDRRWVQHSGQWPVVRS